MPQFKVTGVVEIKSVFAVEASDASAAINKAKRNQHNQMARQSYDSKFIAEEITTNLKGDNNYVK